ncbi:MAG: glucose-1-phosphate adenylyltransferase [Clostridia bacterium]|nr:glucose-1-phosphate adenylyltransferase [Clostridia bacterium]
MNFKTECVAMLLAGGQGSRLGALTKTVAKPAIPYGGKYRIIDFPLSNCINSGIDTVGVLTQYQPLELNDYIGSGQPWDLDRMTGGVHILPPYQQIKGADWYKGTANAIYQNLSFIERYNPEYVLILSGDHIYKMDYSDMLDFHNQNNADCTIAVLEVPFEEASRFGIMNTNEDNSIYEFQEKPKEPKSNKASMGIYIFNWKDLKHYLTKDEENPNSSNDFGKDIIPAMLNDNKRMFAYPFEGYWKDVGTIDSLWEANMDLLNPKTTLELDDPEWKIYARTRALPPHFVADTANIQNSLISEGCTVEGDVLDSVLFSGAKVESGAAVRDSVIMPGAVIKSGAVVQYAIVAENAVIEEDAVIGARPEDCDDKDSWGVATIGPDITIAKGDKIPPKAMLGM